MPRRLRCNTGGYAYHVLNRAVGRAALFPKDGDYAAFETVLRHAKEQRPVRLLAYTLMPNHWRLVLWPKRDGDLSEFLRWLTVTHTPRYRAHYHTEGTGRWLKAQSLMWGGSPGWSVVRLGGRLRSPHRVWNKSE